MTKFYREIVKPGTHRVHIFTSRLEDGKLQFKVQSKSISLVGYVRSESAAISMSRDYTVLSKNLELFVLSGKKEI